MDDRTPVLAVGSNASPARLRGKLTSGTASPVVPLVECTVRHLGVGHSAHVSRPGYVPAAPFASPGAARRVFVTWLDPAQLRVVDASEPTYDRLVLDDDRHPVRSTSGERLPPCHVYASRRGLLCRNGAPMALTGQPSLLLGLLERSAELRARAGPDAAGWLRACVASAALRTEIAGLFVSEIGVADHGLAARRTDGG
jgi:hypothetical protein